MYKRILLPIDLHEEASWSKTLPVVRAMLEAFGGELHVLTVFPNLQVGAYRLDLPEDTEVHLARQAREGLEAFVAEHPVKATRVEIHVATGSVYHAILDTANAIDADLIAMASHRPQMSDYLIGPNSSHVVRHAKISVLVVR